MTYVVWIVCYSSGQIVQVFRTHTDAQEFLHNSSIGGRVERWEIT